MVRNTRETWGWPARALHWIVAVMVLGLYAHGLWMEDLAPAQERFQLWLHAAVGITLLLFVVAGFVWWLLNRVPEPAADTPAWQHRAAHLTHWGLYALMFGSILAGWALTGTLREPVTVELFGFIGVPQLLAPGSGAHELLEEAHELLAHLLIVLVGLHVAAALYHHFVLRDPVLWRMLGPKPRHEA